MSTIFNRLVGASALTTQRAGHTYHHHLLQHMKWCHDQTSHHYQHGIPGIPTDGKVVLLKNSSTGSQLYLVGTIHISKESPRLVEKVIDSISPDAIAIEQPKEAIKALTKINWEPVNVNEHWFIMFVRSMMSPGGLQRKINMFRLERRLQADGIIPGEELKVALEGSRKLKAKLVPIDQDADVENARSPTAIPWKIYFQRRIALYKELKTKSIVHLINWHLIEDGSRSQSREIKLVRRILSPELYKAVIEDRDIHMFTRLRRMEEKLIVAVVGIDHMDGIELLWKRTEDADDDELLLAASENGALQTGDVAVEKMEARI